MVEPNRDYDEVLYPSYVHAQTHPDRLWVIATLAGMAPAAVERCRVLELGCGNGSNLLPMAATLPDSEFIGIDRASLPIKKGNEMAAALGLANISLAEADLLELSSEIGKFDYIIAHGLYAWVPDEVKQKILGLCRSQLKPDGVAFVSYNAYPGGHITDMFRNMLLFHSRNFTEPKQRIKQSIALLKFLGQSQVTTGGFNDLMTEETKRILEYDPELLYHDLLSANNTPIYFFQFAEQAAQHDLQFLGEADFFECQYHIYPPETAALLQKMAAESAILKEQYLDFLKCRRFRQTLLCHGEVEINRAPEAGCLREMYVASCAQPIDPQVDFSPRVTANFAGARGARVSTDHPITKAALVYLSKNHRPILFADLFAASRELAGEMAAENNDNDADTLADILLRIYGTGLLDLFPRAPDYVSVVSDRPVASPLARYQIERDSIVTNLRHTNVEVEDELGRQLLRLLDGTRNRQQIFDDLTNAAISGGIFRDQQNEPIRDANKVRQNLTRGLTENLQKIAELALLVQ